MLVRMDKKHQHFEWLCKQKLCTHYQTIEKPLKSLIEEGDGLV